jgi:Family of unknown function (DUF6058)
MDAGTVSTGGQDMSAKREALGAMTMEDARLLTEADVAYIRANYRTLEELCAGRPESPRDVRLLIDERRLPRASYVLPDGTGMYPEDYFVLPDAAGGPRGLRDAFERRYTAARRATEKAHPRGDLPEHRASGPETAWRGYMVGLYGVCLWSVMPETMVRKDELLALIEGSMRDPQAGDQSWLERLRRSVDALDRIERPFSPDYDRVAFEVAPSRDRFIARPRELYPQAFAAQPVRS